MWLIQENIFDNEELTIGALAMERQSYKLFNKLVPPIKERCIFRGSIEHAKKLKSNSLVKVYYGEGEYDYDVVANAFNPADILNSDFVCLNLKEFEQQIDLLFNKFGDTDFLSGGDHPILFVRPNSGNKEFSGCVIDRGFIQAYLNQFRNCGVEEIIVSSPKSIEKEYRFVVHQDRVIAGSLYATSEKIISNPVEFFDPVFSYAQGVVETSQYRPDVFWTLDCCELSSGDFKIIEANAFSTSSLYSCDRKPIIRAIENYGY